MIILSGSELIAMDVESAIALLQTIDFLLRGQREKMKELITKHKEGFQAWQSLKDTVKRTEEIS